MNEKKTNNDQSNNFNIQSFLAYRMNILAKRMSNALSDIYMNEFEINIPEWRTLLWINSNEKVYAKDISFHCLMDKTQVSRVIGNLEKRNLITRKVDNDDQRSQVLSLTTEGKELIEKIIPKVNQWESELCNTLTQKQYDDFFNLMDIIETQMIEQENSL